MIEQYNQASAACLEYDPAAPEVARLVSEWILSTSAALCLPSSDAGLLAPSREISCAKLEEASDSTASTSEQLIVDHIGSTSVPGCAGKGIIDLMMLYPEGGLEHAKQVLDSLGFQRQTTRDPFPESRPMRLGAVSYDGKRYCLHVHVISCTSGEAAELRGFRDDLIRDPDLRRCYVERKRAIIAAGIIDSVDYCEAKGEFIAGALKARHPVPECPSPD